MPNINILILGGNITRDPELRFTPGGAAIADFGVAFNRKWKSETGEEREEVSFFDCTAFGRTAENISQYFRKGSPILIEGRIKQESWEDKKDGRKRSRIKVLVEKFHFCGDTKKKDYDDAPEPRRGQPPPSKKFADEQSPAQPEEDDVPF